MTSLSNLYFISKFILQVFISRSDVNPSQWTNRWIWNWQDLLFEATWKIVFKIAPIRYVARQN